MPLENENNLSRAYLENSWYAKRHASETDVTNFLKVLKKIQFRNGPPPMVLFASVPPNLAPFSTGNATLIVVANQVAIILPALQIQRLRLNSYLLVCEDKR